MKLFWEKYKFVLIAVLFWRLMLAIVEVAAPHMVFQHPGYIGPIPLANMDGIHYLRIANTGYFQYGEAFFPLYPLVIKIFSSIIPLPPAQIAWEISFVSFTAALLVLYDMLQEKSTEVARWTIIFLLAFPTAFFFTAVYSEGIFFLISLLCFYFLRKRKWWVAGIFGALASATRLFGVLLLIPMILEYFALPKKSRRLSVALSFCIVLLGLVFYMIFLYQRSGDPLLFFHVQPAFGANRSGTTIILLPQVFWRYGKIIFTAFMQPTPASYMVTVFELLTTVGALSVIYYGWKKKISLSYLLYSLFAVLLPTLTGTLSSMPRYVLSAFPIFMILGTIRNNTIKYTILCVFVIIEIVAAAFFLRGWFIA
jgi:hypothetical protein